MEATALRLNSRYRLNATLQGPFRGSKKGLRLNPGAILVYQGQGQVKDKPYVFRIGLFTVNLGTEALEHLKRVS
jgi:hypothetical protein